MFDTRDLHKDGYLFCKIFENSKTELLNVGKRQYQFTAWKNVLMLLMMSFSSWLYGVLHLRLSLISSASRSLYNKLSYHAFVLCLSSESLESAQQLEVGSAA